MKINFEIKEDFVIYFVGLSAVVFICISLKLSFFVMVALITLWALIDYRFRSLKNQTDDFDTPKPKDEFPNIKLL